MDGKDTKLFRVYKEEILNFSKIKTLSFFDAFLYLYLKDEKEL
jgi:hypothetical protein|tara:strand:+ start:15710 stop:15838 length:129 start_codon:yes stop_codon:yes gene_type:complete